MKRLCYRLFVYSLLLVFVSCQIEPTDLIIKPKFYFPLNQNDSWSYDGDGSDTLKTTVKGIMTSNNKMHQQFVTVHKNGASDTAYYRKDTTTGDYYHYVRTKDLSDSLFVFPQSRLDVLFLKETLTTGQTWNSDHTAVFAGSPAIIRFKFTCINANATVKVNTHTFTSVYQVQLMLQAKLADSSVQNYTNATADPIDYYYAKEIGLIKLADSMGKKNIRYWEVK